MHAAARHGHLAYALGRKRATIMLVKSASALGTECQECGTEESEMFPP